MFYSKISQLIDKAIQECIDYGSGVARSEFISVNTDWIDEENIEINILQDGVVKFTTTERMI